MIPTVNKRNRIQPIYNTTLTFANELNSQLDSCSDYHFVRRTKLLIRKVTKSLLTAIQSNGDSKALDALANFLGYSTELSLMLMRAEGMKYYDKKTSANLMHMMYQIRRGVSGLSNT